jgi:aerobic-type carbon monoxide dehydrogenase small subunit (CoxS/CutS family)
MQAAFAKHDALQYSYATSGDIIDDAAHLQKSPKTSIQKIISAMEDNKCRPATHKIIVEVLEEITQG